MFIHVLVCLHVYLGPPWSCRWQSTTAEIACGSSWTTWSMMPPGMLGDYPLVMTDSSRTWTWPIEGSLIYPAIKWWLVIWLVVWTCLEHLLFFHLDHLVGNFIIPTDFHSIIFQRGRLKPPPEGQISELESHEESHPKILDVILGKFHHDLTSRPNPGIMVKFREIIPIHGLNSG